MSDTDDLFQRLPAICETLEQSGGFDRSEDILANGDDREPEIFATVDAMLRELEQRPAGTSNLSSPARSGFWVSFLRGGGRY